MNMSYLYENMHIIPNDCKGNFVKKKNLSVLEKVALEAIAVEFFVQYERGNFGDVSADRADELRNYMRWNDDNIDILDGVYDTYEFDGFLFGSIWTTENDCIIMTAYKIDDIEDWTECYWGDFEKVYIRLD